MTTDNSALASIGRTAEMVAAYVSYNSVRPSDIPALIATMHEAVCNLGAPQQAAPEAKRQKLSNSEIRHSIQAAGLVSFLDGKTYKTLKRHLKKHGFTPDTYRTRFGLPSDYPMVAPTYAERRSVLAKELGFGRAGRK